MGVSRVRGRNDLRKDEALLTGGADCGARASCAADGAGVADTVQEVVAVGALLDGRARRGHTVAETTNVEEVAVCRLAEQALASQAIHGTCTVTLHSHGLVAPEDCHVRQLVKAQIEGIGSDGLLAYVDAVSNVEVTQGVDPQTVKGALIVPQILSVGAINVDHHSSEIGDGAPCFDVGRHDPHRGVGFQGCCVACQIHHSEGRVQVVPVGTLPAV